MPDVAIVGFGPVGATLAALLGRRGLDVVVLERDADVFPLPRAAHIDHTGLRTLQEVGCLDALLPRMLPNPGLDYVAPDGTVLVSISGDQGSVSGLPASMYFHQPEFDRALRAAAAALPNVEVRLGVEVTDPAALDATWVVGCDGASSTVRAAAGLELEDLRFDQDWLVVDLILREDVPTLPERAVGVCDPSRPLFAIPIPEGRYRFELMVQPGDPPEDRVLELLADWIPSGAAEVERAAVYTFHGLVAKRWRAGRLLLAGDSAHQMPPFLGQGMCSGLRDAANLAWKLDRVVRGAPEALLDTYGPERAPHVRAIVRAVLRFGEILVDPTATAARIGFTLPPLEPGPLVLAGGGELFVQADRFDDVVGQRFLVVGRGETAGWWQEEVGALVLDEAPNATIARWLERRGADTVVVRPDRYVLGTGPLDAITERVRDVV